MIVYLLHAPEEEKDFKKLQRDAPPSQKSHTSLRISCTKWQKLFRHKHEQHAAEISRSQYFNQVL